MFLGTHTPKIDEKGRLILPAKFRDELSEGVVITRMQENCLTIYTRATFEAEMRKISAAPTSVKQVRDYQRMVASGASDETPDKQGRVTIPPQLRRYAGLDKDVVVVGAIDRVEIWDAAKWDAYSAAQEEVFATMNEELFSGGG